MNSAPADLSSIHHTHAPGATRGPFALDGRNIQQHCASCSCCDCVVVLASRCPASTRALLVLGGSY